MHTYIVIAALAKSERIRLVPCEIFYHVLVKPKKIQKNSQCCSTNCEAVICELSIQTKLLVLLTSTQGKTKTS